MCIAILSTAHPSYKLILIDNRDEYLTRPTAQATWWPDTPHVLGGRDLLRAPHGTWLGVTSTGKIAVLTNFREPTQGVSAVSRGAIIKKWLAEDVGSTQDFVRDVVDTGLARDAGGFSLVCGRMGEELAVISNRAEDQSQVPWVGGDVVQTVGLSNAAFVDRSWKKVARGEELVLDAIREGVREGWSEERLVEALLGVLCDDTLERVSGVLEEGVVMCAKDMRNTIFVPALGWKGVASLDSDDVVEVVDVQMAQGLEMEVDQLYGTQKQTVVLVDHDLRVRFVERTLFDDYPRMVPEGKGDVDITFKVKA